MPSTATITAFYSFTANTKAKASQVNTNFSNFRGHIVAIDPNTTTAINETYDLGSTEYRWRTGYFRDVDFKSNTSTGQALQIIGDTAAGQGAFLFKHAGNIRARLGSGNQYIDGDTNTSQFDFKINGTTIASLSINKWSSNIPTSTGQWDFIINGSTLSSIKNQGFERNITKKSVLYTGTNSTSSTYNITTTTTLISTLSMTSYGSPFKIGLNISPKTSTAYVLLINTTTANAISNIYFYRDGTASSNLVGLKFNATSAKNTSTSNDSNLVIEASTIDNSVTSGSHTYYCYADCNNGRLFINEGTRLHGIEIL